jgi:uncharacterized membrane protein
VKKASLAIMAIFYLLAGINHFRNPTAYYAIIPPYLPHPHLINIVSGFSEIILALLLFNHATRKIACYLIIAMLIAFVPAHIYMIQAGFCTGSFCLPSWALWVRLLILQPLLIAWAWKTRE